MAGIEAGERGAQDLHKVASLSQVVVHVLEVRVHMVAIPGGSGNTYTRAYRMVYRQIKIIAFIKGPLVTDKL